MTTTRRVLFVVSTVLILAVIAGVGWYFTAGPRNDTTQTSPTPPTTSSNPPQQGSSTTPEPQTYTVSVYFSKHPESDDDPSKTFPVKRTSPDLGVATFAITELLKGPSVDETNRGYFTTARLRAGDSTCGGKDFTISITNSIATLKFCRPFDHLGVVADGQADSEIKSTLLQFETIKKVIILNQQGNCEFDLSGQNLCLQ